MATIITVNEEEIVFSDGSIIDYFHHQNCCEINYADFEQLDDIARNTDFDTDNMIFQEADYGFMFGNENGKMFFIPCYSEQNGCYSHDVDIYYNNKLVLTAYGE